MSEENIKPGPDKEMAQSSPVPQTPPPAVAPKPVPAVPAAAVKPAVSAATLQSPARRQFMLNWLAIAWAAFASATIVALSTVGRFMFPNVLFEPKMNFKIGKPGDYELGVVDTRWTEKFGIWVVRSPEGLYALSTICTHLGCTPSWLDTEQKFKCPCHGSGFYKTGMNFEGPAPRPLERFAVSLAEDGQVSIDKSKKFQFEKGEWADPRSFLMV